MEDEDGTCLLDVLCDPQALNDFLHGTNELQTEDLLINSSSGEPSLFTDTPSPVSLLGDGRDLPDSPPPGCVDLSFLEEALMSSPEGGGDPQAGRGDPEAGGRQKKADVEETEAAACDILQQSLQEADITEQTMALEAGLAAPADGLSLYSPAPLLSPPAFVPKSVTLPVTPVLPRDSQAAVEPPQPSLLAVGPGCPSLKPAAPPQLMGLLPGNVFPTPSAEASFSLSPVRGSGMIIHKAVPAVAARPLITPALTAAAPGIVLQRAPLPIQPKPPISIQPRLVQISPKPSAQKPAQGLAFVPRSASPNILLSQPAVQKSGAAPPPPPQLSKPLSLQLLNQGASFVLQPQGLFQGQNQFLLSGQSPVAISQPAAAAAAAAARPLLTPGPRGGPVHGAAPPAGPLVDGPQILTVPQRQLNFGPVFAAPAGQLALHQAAVLSGPLQLQPASPAVFQMPAPLAGSYPPAAQGRPAALVHGPALGNHITLINSSAMLPSDLASISIVNGPSVVQRLPFAAAAAAAPPEVQPSLRPASVVLLPERSAPDEPNRSEDAFQQLTQRYAQILQPVSVQRAPAGLLPSTSSTSSSSSSSSPPAVAILQRPPTPTPTPDPADAGMPKLLLPQMAEEEAMSAISHNPAFMQHLQQEALSSPLSSHLLAGAPPTLPTESLASPPAGGGGEAQHVEDSPLPSDGEEPRPLGSSPSDQDAASSPPEVSARPPHAEPQVRFVEELPAPVFRRRPPPLDSAFPGGADSSAPRSSSSTPRPQPEPSAGGGGVRRLTVNEPTPSSAPESRTPALDVGPPSPAARTQPVHGNPAPRERGRAEAGRPAPSELAGPEQQSEERLTPAVRRHRFQQRLCSDRAAVQNPLTGPAFPSLGEAVGRLLPYHACAGETPSQEHCQLVDQEFDSVSGFLLKRTKDMVNKYRQLLVQEAQQESPSAEMVMLERLFLQAERYALAEDRRRARRDPESFMMTLATSASSPPGAGAGGSPSPPPAWSRLSDRPPGLKTYRSSSRGALRLTIKQESGSRKVVRNSACDPGLKRDRAGQLSNGGGACEEVAHGAAPPGAPQAGFLSKSADPRSTPASCSARLESPPRDAGAPKLKYFRADPEQRFSRPPAPAPPALQEESVLSEHLQSAIDSILELQRLQGPAAAAAAPPGPPLDQAVAGILEGHL